MKKFIILFFIAISGLMISPLNAQNMKVKITIGNKVFMATLNDSEAAKVFLEMLPLSVTMNEHNGNEKYYNLPKSLPGRATNPGGIEVGDLMVWSSSTLVLFYAKSSTNYSYVRLGKVDNISGLREALGRGSIKVEFELVKQEKESKGKSN